jgi:hypothetical protein
VYTTNSCKMWRDLERRARVFQNSASSGRTCAPSAIPQSTSIALARSSEGFRSSVRIPRAPAVDRRARPDRPAGESSARVSPSSAAAAGRRLHGTASKRRKARRNSTAALVRGDHALLHRPGISPNLPSSPSAARHAVLRFD